LSVRGEHKRQKPRGPARKKFSSGNLL